MIYWYSILCLLSCLLYRSTFTKQILSNIIFKEFSFSLKAKAWYMVMIIGLFSTYVVILFFPIVIHTKVYKTQWSTSNKVISSDVACFFNLLGIYAFYFGKIFMWFSSEEVDVDFYFVHEFFKSSKLLDGNLKKLNRLNNVLMGIFFWE